jgi:hypothetical protein
MRLRRCRLQGFVVNIRLIGAPQKVTRSESIAWVIHLLQLPAAIFGVGG